MPKDLTKEQVNFGKIVYEWWVKEYEQFERSRRWYIIMTIVGAVLMAYALYTANYLFAMIVALLGIVFYLHEIQIPVDVYFAITETGIIIGKKYYRFTELENFWLIYNPPEVKNLYFGINGLIKHRLAIPLIDFDPRPIREYLAKFLSEDLSQEEEPLSDRWSRILKIH